MDGGLELLFNSFACSFIITREGMNIFSLPVYFPNEVMYVLKWVQGIIMSFYINVTIQKFRQEKNQMSHDMHF